MDKNQESQQPDYEQSVQPKWWERLFGYLFLLLPWNWGGG
jgi:hypothetical protein